MPGVADQIRKTQLKQDYHSRKKEMDELIAMAKEGRLHEADERQLETLKLALELEKALGERQQAPEAVVNTSQIDQEDLINAVKAAVSEIVTNLPSGTNIGAPKPSEDPARPGMKHTSLADFIHTDEDVSISHGEGLTQDKEGDDDAGDKLEKLRKLKGNG